MRGQARVVLSHFGAFSDSAFRVYGSLLLNLVDILFDTPANFPDLGYPDTKFNVVIEI
jgi:hypothetical protein